MQTFNLVVDSLSNAVVTAGSAITSASFDTTKAINASAWINCAFRSGGTNTAAIAVTHSSDDSTFTAVPASALYNPATGVATAFTSVTTAATDQTLALNLQQCKRYVRVEVTGTTITQNAAITVAYQAHYTEA